MGHSIPLREIKKARSKLAIFKACLDLIENRTFREIRLEDICAKAEISKVTFFKFFPRKEDLLVYFMCIWLQSRLLDLKREPRRGMDGIRFLLRHIAEGARECGGIMLSLISFLAEERMHPRMPVLSDAEIHVLFPGIEHLVTPEVPELGLLFHRFVLEAQADGDIRPDARPDDVVKLLFSIFYGAYLTAHLYQERDIMAIYDLHLKTLVERE